MNTCHTAKQIFLDACKVFEVLCPHWQEILISLAYDREQKMMGCIQGVATHFIHACKPDFVGIWCGLHQVDLKLQMFDKELFIMEDDDAHENERGFNSILTGLIA